MPPHIGKYQLRDRIGRGGVADVWRAETSGSGNLVAIKILRADVLSESKYAEAFLMEARAHAGLTHRGIVQLEDLGVVSQEDDISSHLGAPFLVMELANGTIERKLGVEHFSQFRGIAKGLLEALAYAHARGVIHRDLKPANILKFEDSYKLGDFGLAFASNDWEAPSLSLGPSAGTPRYMAPEQILGHWRDFGPWTDLYALGCVLYRLVCGHGPHDRSTPKDTCRAHLEENPQPLRSELALPHGFEDILFKLIAKTPEDRYQSAAHVIEDLERLDDSALPALAVDEDDSPTQIETQVESRVRSKSRRQRFWQQDLPTSDIKPSRGLFGLRGIPFVGLEKERQDAWQHLEKITQAGGLSTLVIHGRIDAPQSGLTDWLCSNAAEKGIANVLRMMHSRIGGPREGLISLAEDSLKLWNLEGRELRVRLRDYLADHVDSRLFEHDLEVLVDAISRREQRRVIRPLRERFRAFAHIVRRSLNQGPTLLRIDHAQWSREAHGFVTYLAEEFRDTNLLVIVNMSGPGEEALAQWSEDIVNVTPVLLHVRPLDHGEMLDCVRRMLPLDTLSASSIADLAKGDARFAHALISYAHEQNLLRSGEDGVQLLSHRLPGSLETVRAFSVRSLLDDFVDDPSVQHSMELAACFGAAPDAIEWRSALTLNGLPICPDILTDFANRGLIQFVGPRWHFADSMVVSALQSDAKKAGRWATWNQTCAQVLKAGASTDADVRLRIARHLMEANEIDESIGWYKEAARAFMQSDVRTTQTVLQERRSILTRLQVPNHDLRMIDQQNFEAQLLHLMGKGSEARKLSLETLSFSKASGYKIGEAYATILIARTEADSGNFKESEHLMGQAFSLFGECDQEYNQCVAALGAGYAALRTSSVSQAERWFRVAIECSGDPESFAERCHSYSYLGYTYSISGRADQARDLLAKAIDLARTGHSPWALWRALGMLAELERLDGNLGRARELFLEVLQWHTLLKSPPYRVFETHVNLAMVELRERNYEEAMTYVDLASKGGHWTGQTGHAWLVEMTRALSSLGMRQREGFGDQWRYAMSLIDPDLVDTDLVWLLETALEIGGDAEFESQCNSILLQQRAVLKSRLTT